MDEVCKVIDCDQTIKDKVLAVFQDDLRMVDVVHCESGSKDNYARQFDKQGKPLMSPTSDVGVMQINQVHWSEAKKLGLDIFYSEDDNIKMGRRIYDTQGIKAWSALQSDCYKKISGSNT